VRSEGFPTNQIVGTDRGLVRESSRVAEQVAQGDAALGMIFERAVDPELRQIPSNRNVELDQALLDGQEHGSRGVHLGTRLHPEHGLGGDRLSFARASSPETG
jgi:hypothetical protein